MDQKHRNMHVMKYTCATKSIRSQRLKQPMCLVPNSFFPLPSLFFSSLKPLIPQLADERTFPYVKPIQRNHRDNMRPNGVERMMDGSEKEIPNVNAE